MFCLVGFVGAHGDGLELLELQKKFLDEIAPFVEFAGELCVPAAKQHGITLEVVRPPQAKRGFLLLPGCWVVERPFAWATKCRRLVKGCERLPYHTRRPPQPLRLHQAQRRAVEIAQAHNRL